MLEEIVIFVASLLVVSTAYVKYKFSFWSRRNVPFIEPQFPQGNFKEVGRRTIADLTSEQYSQMKDKGRFFGMFFYLQPLAMITDLELIKSILIRDFNYFSDRGLFHNAKDDPLSANLLTMEGAEWRSLRARLTPTFTSGKIKMMFPALKVIGDQMCDFLEKSVEGGIELEVKDCMARFTSDVIGSCAFGINCNSFVEFDQSVERKCKFDWRLFIRLRHSIKVRLFLRLFPELGQLLRIKAISDEVNDFVYNLVRTTIHDRETRSVHREDFMSLLIELKNGEMGISVDEIAAQSFAFFLAGFDAASSNQTYCLYELALNQNLQDKARECVREAVERYGGFSYEAASNMPYLDQCIKETLRMYPALTILERKAVADYRVPDSDVVIPKGMRINIPVFAIQRDEKYYPNPNVFDPDRFLPDEVAKRHSFTFLPFGEGPRICIGLRFAMLQSRVGLAMLLNKFRVSVCPRTSIPVEHSTKYFVLKPKKDLWLKFESI